MAINYYSFYLGKMLLPVNPEKLNIKIKNQNKTLNLINGDEINILNNQGLSEIEFEALFPQVKYPFAVYKKGVFQGATVFTEQLKEFKKDKKPFQFIVTRLLPVQQIAKLSTVINKKANIFHTNMTVSLEDYTMIEDSRNGFDLLVTIRLKEYKYYGTQKAKISDNGEMIIEEERETNNSPEPKTNGKGYIAKGGESLWNIAKSYYGNGTIFQQLLTANVGKVASANLIPKGTSLSLPTLKSLKGF